MGKFKVGVLGAGRMGTALLKGLLSFVASPKEICVFDVDPQKRAACKKLKVKIATSGGEVAAGVDLLLLAVKPQKIDGVLEEIRDAVLPAQLVVSIAAGIKLAHLSRALPTKKIFRAMPNNPSLVREGMTAICAWGRCSKKDRALVQKIFAAVGEVVWVKEKYMDVVTGLSGSGPAFVYAFIESLIEAGRDLGLSMPLSIKLAEQTLVGSAAVFKAAKLDPIDLINMVKSPGGTTEAGLKVLEEKWFKQSVKQAVAAAARRSKELSR